MRKSPRSLRSRIVWSTTIISAIAMVAMIGTVLLVLNSLLNGRVEASARDRVDAVSATLVQDKNGHLSELETSDDRIDDSVWVFDTTGAQIIGPAAGKNVQAVVNSLSGVATRRTAHHGDHFYRASPVKDEKKGKTIAVVVAAVSYEPYEATQRFVLGGLILLGLAVTAGTGALAAWTVGRTLDPVNAMATSAEEWSEHDLDSRFDPGSDDNEIAHLGATLNLLLDRVATTIRGEQILTSELAHELRTPLTAIRGEAELGLMKSREPDTRERLDRVVALVDRMSATITTLVAIARGHSTSGQRSHVVDAVESVLSESPVPAGVVVDANGIDKDLEAAVPADMLERALAPLIDNAMNHASTRVTVTAARDGRSVSIHISDDGPGVMAGDVFRAGSRDGESTGAGLGLALSRRVARTLGGDIHLTSKGHPTTFTLDVPRH